MAEVVETHDLTAPTQDGWAVDYRIRRDDGEDSTPRSAVGKRRTPLPNEQQTPTLSPPSRTGAAPLRSSTPNLSSRRRHVGHGADLDLLVDPADEGDTAVGIDFEHAAFAGRQSSTGLVGPATRRPP